MASPIYLQRQARRGMTFREILLMHAIGRIAYHGWIDNIQVSWVKIGVEGAHQILQAGANDLGGTLMTRTSVGPQVRCTARALPKQTSKSWPAPWGRVTRKRTTGYGMADARMETVGVTRNQDEDGLKDDRRLLLPEDYVGVGRS